VSAFARARRLASSAVLAWLLWRSFGPELPVRYSSPQRRPLRVAGRTVFVGEREFFVRETGPEDAPRLVLVHGWSLDGEMTYYPLIEALADRYRIIVPDLRNHGKSDWVRGRYEPSDMADELAGVLDALGVRNAVVMGYSLGGMVVMELARRHRYLVGSAVLAATAARPVPLRRPLAWAWFWLARAIARVSRREAAHLTVRVLRFTGSLDRSHERWMYEGLVRRDGTLFYNAGFAAWHFDARSWVGGLGVPTTVVIPTSDRLIPVDAQEELAELLPDAEIVRLRGAGHESIFTRVDDYIAVIDGVSRKVTP
jgi:3-oxoadipate enol-lactonase